MNNKAFGLDYELAKQFADYLGVTLKITVRQNISQLFDDLDDGQADMLAAGLVYTAHGRNGGGRKAFPPISSTSSGEPLAWN